ncbi:HYD1 signature containing ADP-ribosyltransferase family protein [Streptomyces sp. NPDC008150]|uniref:HYD1 signature containing ADP-ribosyltransferase family protein n=1 Tax=Streptomyces sp. NPDC008150 TaxID=3364816 RepID=UPI0036EFC275
MGGHPVHLFHYTTEEGQAGILRSQLLLPSLRSTNPKDARYGDGQYLTDITPGSLAGSHLSHALVRMPFAAARFTHFVQIDTSGLTVNLGRAHVYVVLGTEPLDLNGRIKDWGMN